MRKTKRRAQVNNGQRDGNNEFYPLQHRLFRMLLSEMSAEHHDLLLHNDVRWLSKGKALERFCVRGEIPAFLRSSKHKKAETHLNRMLDDNFIGDVCFLSDIFKHLNDLNVGLQGRDKTVIELVEQMRAFQVKLDLFGTDLSTGRMLQFSDALQMHLIPGTHYRCNDGFRCEVKRKLC